MEPQINIDDYQSIIISTDLEPDDIISLKFIAPKLKEKKILIIVGESNISKLSIIEKICKDYNISCDNIVQDFMSTKSYGSNPETPKTEEEIIAFNEKLQKGNSEELKEFIKDSESTVLAILLKPPMEFMRLEDSILEKIDAIMYGSFNMDGLLRGNDSKELKMSILNVGAKLNKFKKLLIMDRSTAIGRDAIYTKSEDTYVYNLLSQEEKKLIYGWNDVTIENFNKGIKKLETKNKELKINEKEIEENKESIDKKQKILKSIEVDKLQFCNADTFIISYLLSPNEFTSYIKPIELQYPNEKIKYIPTTESTKIFGFYPSENISDDNADKAAKEAKEKLAKEELNKLSKTILNNIAKEAVAAAQKNNAYYLALNNLGRKSKGSFRYIGGKSRKRKMRKIKSQKRKRPLKKRTIKKRKNKKYSKRKN